MNIKWAAGRGIRTGAIVGGFGALALTLATSGLGPLGTALYAAANFAMGAIGGAGVGGVTFATTHVLSHATGLNRLVGDIAPDPATTAAPARKRGRNQKTAQPTYRLDETDDRNTGFRRQLEERRQIEELYEYEGIGR